MLTAHFPLDLSQSSSSTEVYLGLVITGPRFGQIEVITLFSELPDWTKLHRGTAY